MISQISSIPENWIAQMKKHGLIMNAKTETYGVWHNGLLVGCCGILFQKGNVALFKSDFILEEYRGLGLHKKSLEARIKLCKSKGVRKAIAHCTKMSLNNYLLLGAKPVTYYKNGIVKVCFSL